jgi:hypothetical protein
MSQYGETAEDCPWALHARTWQRLSRDQFNAERIAADLPDLTARMKEDAERPAWKLLWGQSLNYDELAQATIVDPTLLDQLFEILRAPPRADRFVHAGAEHTYGYLFSTLQTPYGYKRARWVRSDIEDGFGLPRGTLGPIPNRGSLLSNLTYFAGRVALQDDSARAKTELSRLKPGIEPSLIQYPWKSLKIIRIEERFENHGGDPTEKTAAIITLRTDLVEFPRLDQKKIQAGNTHLLIYSIHDPRFEPAHRLITAFPVNTAFVERVTEGAKKGANEPILVRYNAFVARDAQVFSKEAARPSIGTKRVFKRTLR